MKETEPNGPVSSGGAGHGDSRARDEVFASYIDRLNAGEPIDPEEVRRKHPEFAAELLDAFASYEALGTQPGAPPPVFGGYSIVRELGRGGMGVVYEAIEAAMDRRVALKILPSGLLVSEKAVARFRREARIAGRLQHPNIVAVYAMGVEGSTPYMAMELVQGETLEKVLERKRPPASEDSRNWGTKAMAKLSAAFAGGASAHETTTVLPVPSGGTAPGLEETAEPRRTDPDLGSPIPATTEGMDLSYSIRMARTFAAVASGLHHAHSMGIVHRDLKPSNLILDERGTLRVLDFGIARLEGQENLTASGELVGTPRYMSPEQARADAAALDHRSDVYSLGATLYEVLTLSPPFHGRTAEETLRSIAQREPRSPRQLNPRVPKDLQTIVLKCLEKDPAARYGTAEALEQDLLRFCRGDPIEARPLSTGEKVLRRLRRSWRRAAVFAFVLVLLASVVVLWRLHGLEKREAMVARYDQQVVDAIVKLQMSGALFIQVGGFAWSGQGYDPFLLTQGADKGENDLLNSAVKTLEEASTAVPERADAFYHLARASLLLGDKESARKDLACAVERGFLPARVLAASLDGKSAESLRETAELGADPRQHAWAKLWLEAQSAAAQGRWKDAANAQDGLIDLEVSGEKTYLGSSLESYLGCGIARLHLGELSKARDRFVAASTLWPQAAELRAFQAVVCLVEGKDAEAEDIFEDVYRRSPRNDVANLIAMLYSIRFGRYEEGLRWTERMGPGYFKEVWRATCLNGLGRHEEAAEVAARLPDIGPRFALSYVLAAVALGGVGDVEASAAMASKAMELAPRSGVPASLLANALRLQGKTAESMAMLEKSLELEPGAARVRYYLGLTYMQVGRFEDAARSFRAILDTGGEAGRGLIESGELHLALGQTLEILGRSGESAEAFTKAIEAARTPEKIDPRWLPVMARVQSRRGLLTDAVRTLELALEKTLDDSSASPSQAHWLEGQLEGAVHAALPDIPTYRSIETALAGLRWTSLVEPGAEWAFFRGKTAPSAGLEWTAIDFGDSAWEKGPSGFGYGDDDDATVLDDMPGAYTTLYTRREIVIEDPGSISRLELKVTSDDGFVAYLNGKEVARHAAPAGDILPHDAVASRSAPEPLEPVTVRLERGGLLVPGRNVLALQGLNVSKESGDFTLIPVLAAERTSIGGRGRELFEAFRAAAAGPDARGRLAHLEGRLLEAEGRHAEAFERFIAAVRLDPARPEPRLAALESLKRLGDSREAERRLRAWIEASCPGGSDLWTAWASTSLGALRRSPRELLETLPCAGAAATGAGAADGASSPAADTRQLLETLDRRAPIRIRCGAGPYTSQSGEVWGGDRFYFHTSTSLRLAGRRVPARVIEGTSDEPLYQAEHRFGGSNRAGPEGYRIPLPPGSWTVTLHFAELWHRKRGARVFDVLLEGRAVLERHEPLAAGFATADRKRFEIEVIDGLLEIDFLPHAGEATVSAIEIEPR